MKAILISTVVLMSGLLTACASTHDVDSAAPPDTRETTVPVVSKPSAAVIDTINKLKNYGASVQVVGDFVKVVIPAKDVFVGVGAQLTQQAGPLLNQVIHLVAGQPKESIHVGVYTYPRSSKVIDQALTQRQANAVQQYLWRHGSRSRLIDAVGYGAAHEVTYDNDHMSLNYRVEISLRELKSQPKVNLITY